MARGKELTNLQKELIVKLWKEGKSYKKISNRLNIPFKNMSSLIVKYKKRRTIENQKKNRCSTEDFFKIFEEINVLYKTTSNGYSARIAG